MGRVTGIEQLRRILGEPRAATRAKILDALDEQANAFVRASPFALMATTSRDGTIEVSPKGDEPGFARIEDARTLLLPERAGNNLAFGLQNILATGRIAMIFLRSRLWDPASWLPAQRVSFGKIIAPRVGGDEKAAQQIDERVVGAYTTSLWSYN